MFLTETKRIVLTAWKENIEYDIHGIDAIEFTSEGDMRQALNNLQATQAG